MSDQDSNQKKLGDILKKAVTIGASAYAIGEDTLNKTLNTVQLPKEWLKDSIEKVFESYTITVNAEIKLTPKKKSQDKAQDKLEEGDAT